MNSIQINLQVCKNISYNLCLVRNHGIIIHCLSTHPREYREMESD